MNNPRSLSKNCYLALKIAFIGIVTLVLATTPNAQGSEDQAVHWSYGGVNNLTQWGELSPEFATCEIGHNQSPIDIQPNKIESLDEPVNASIEFNYQSVPLEVINNGHTVQVNYAKGSSVKIDGQKYELVQFHFHTPSEHTVQGKAYPMEAHLVHQNDSGEYAVIGLFIEAGTENKLMATIWDRIPAIGSVKKIGERSIDVSRLLPVNQVHYNYIGSLTTPPCSENVNWYVMKEPIQASEQQIEQFRAMYNFNARPAQPLNHRVVRLTE